LVLALVLLLLVFRSVAVPVKAAAGFLFTIAATLGAVVAVFQWGWLAPLFGVDQEGPILSLMPMFLVGVRFGLAMVLSLMLFATWNDLVHLKIVEFLAGLVS
jgi:RND superfamily putative drug exporter